MKFLKEKLELYRDNVNGGTVAITDDVYNARNLLLNNHKKYKLMVYDKNKDIYILGDDISHPSLLSVGFKYGYYGNYNSEQDVDNYYSEVLKNETIYCFRTLLPDEITQEYLHSLDCDGYELCYSYENILIFTRKYNPSNSFELTDLYKILGKPKYVIDISQMEKITNNKD